MPRHRVRSDVQATPMSLTLASGHGALAPPNRKAIVEPAKRWILCPWGCTSHHQDAEIARVAAVGMRYTAPVPVGQVIYEVIQWEASGGDGGSTKRDAAVISAGAGANRRSRARRYLAGGAAARCVLLSLRRAGDRQDDPRQPVRLLPR